MFKNLLVPVDGSEPSMAAVKLAIELARDQGARVTFAHATEPVQVAAWEGAAELPSDPSEQVVTQEMLDRFRAQAAAAGVDASTAVARGDVVDAILDLARVGAADLIVMGSHGRSGLARALVGSKAEGMMRRSRIPVLVAPHG